MKSSKITYENEYGTYSIEIPDGNLTISQMMEDLVIPVLLAAGYSKEVIDDYIGKEE